MTTTARYRNLYAKLLRLYPKPYRERFGEEMEQTFNDLCRERREAGDGLFGFALWVFAETSAGIIRENITFVLMQNITRRLIVWAVVVALILLIPLVAMQFTSEVNWTLSDFVFAGVLLFGTGLTYELVARKAGGIRVPSRRRRCACGSVPPRLDKRCRWHHRERRQSRQPDVWRRARRRNHRRRLSRASSHSGMARALFATALAQMLVPVIALIAWRPSLDDAPGIVGVFMLNAFFVMLFVVSAFSFGVRRGSATAAWIGRLVLLPQASYCAETLGRVIQDPIGHRGHSNMLRQPL